MRFGNPCRRDPKNADASFVTAARMIAPIAIIPKTLGSRKPSDKPRGAAQSSQRCVNTLANASTIVGTMVRKAYEFSSQSSGAGIATNKIYA
jgi:hypothetical protein